MRRILIPAHKVQSHFCKALLQSSKFQAPSSREISSLKLQPRTLSKFEFWILEFLWCLDVGAWSFARIGFAARLSTLGFVSLRA